MAKIVIDTKKCIELAEHIRSTGGVPKDEEDPMPHTFPAHIAHNGWWAVVAINQQTTPVVGPALCGSVNGVKRFGWDYLLQKAIYEATINKEMFTARWLCEVTTETVRSLYLDAEEGETLSKPAVRASLWVELGSFLKQKGWESIHEAYLQSEGYIVRSDGLGLAQVIAQAKAYQDPVQKKLFYLLALMRNQGLWEYKDILNLSSPVNYHEQRGHFRIGTVKILGTELKKNIRARKNISDQEDIEIRFAVRHVIEFIAQLLDVSPSMMHYYFWNHFRNCCNRDSPHCSSCREDCKLPERYQTTRPPKCIMEPICASAHMRVGDMLIEPRVDDTIWQ